MPRLVVLAGLGRLGVTADAIDAIGVPPWRGIGVGVPSRRGVGVEVGAQPLLELLLQCAFQLEALRVLSLRRRLRLLRRILQHAYLASVVLEPPRPCCGGFGGFGRRRRQQPRILQQPGVERCRLAMRDGLHPAPLQENVAEQEAEQVGVRGRLLGRRPRAPDLAARRRRLVSERVPLRTPTGQALPCPPSPFQGQKEAVRGPLDDIPRGGVLGINVVVGAVGGRRRRRGEKLLGPGPVLDTLQLRRPFG